MVADEPESDELQAPAIGAYRSVLRTFGKSAVRACYATGSNLEQQLARLEGRLARSLTPKDMHEIQLQVADRLDRWGQLTAEHLKGKADEVRELLIMLAGTAESVGERDLRYTNQFGDLTTELRAIADLDDLTVIRSSLARKATELKTCVDLMTQEGQHSLHELRSKVSVYETKLKVVEELASRDTLTGLANRRSAEGRMEWHVAQQETYCVMLLDLDCFKQVNDKHGHAAGDDLLRKFSEELQKNMRSTDVVARWGGDEFVVILTCDLEAAQTADRAHTAVGAGEVWTIAEWRGQSDDPGAGGGLDRAGSVAAGQNQSSSDRTSGRGDVSGQAAQRETLAKAGFGCAFLSGFGRGFVVEDDWPLGCLLRQAIVENYVEQ